MIGTDMSLLTTATASAVPPPQPDRWWHKTVRARTLALASLPLAVLCLLAVSTTAQARWTSIDEANAGDDAIVHNAVVNNEHGASLRIYLTRDQRLIGKFTLGKGLLSLDPVTCPTLQIDKETPEDFNLTEHQCEVTGAQARFIFTQVNNWQLESKTFLDLMNGRRLIIRYRLQGAGYGRQAFTLKGSKQALKATLTDDMVVIDD